MAWEPLPHLTLPDDLTDEAAAQLLECLYQLAGAIENHYAAQLRRHYHGEDRQQHPLWPSDDEFPF